ncbi:MAG: hypothetical protein E5Y55_24440 [Mesorhizobium sp.]|uniref:hypothetical protein n=1 Tax=Mesorhizobium sp. TaxID=1871066 RepID=UPI001200AF33|nr:hypothetical protein [Mesorhizobium sp.]TIM41534.1 MAG: hypothetical protein E5Y55_24440 [Mesorhizobium sp.]
MASLSLLKLLKKGGTGGQRPHALSIGGETIMFMASRRKFLKAQGIDAGNSYAKPMTFGLRAKYPIRRYVEY